MLISNICSVTIYFIRLDQVLIHQNKESGPTTSGAVILCVCVRTFVSLLWNLTQTQDGMWD